MNVLTLNLYIHTYTYSAAKIAYEIFQSRGLFGLYAGVTPSVMRAFIVSSSRFAAYEGTIALIDGKLLKG